jgi:hypothetical protein
MQPPKGLSAGCSCDGHSEHRVTGATVRQVLARRTVAQIESLARCRLAALAPMPQVNANDAIKFGAFHLKEALQAFNAHLTFGFGGLQATLAGYLYDIRKHLVVPLTPPWSKRAFSGCSAMIDDFASHPDHVLNVLYVAPSAFGELGDAFRRSSHWRELAEQAEDEGESLLLFWMAAECLCKTTHNEEIRSKLLAACGFPTGRNAKGLGQATARALTGIPGYRQWRHELMELFDSLRVARNKIVHSGYRHVDLPALLREEHRALGLPVLRLVTKCLAEMALQGLNQRYGTLAAMWHNYPELTRPNGVVHHARWFIDRLSDA